MIPVTGSGMSTPAADTSSAGPLIVACLRHSDHRPFVDPLTAHVDRHGRGAGPAAAEWAALEHALRVAQAWGGRVLAVCVGPPDADRTLRAAAAVGAQVMRVVLPKVPAVSGPDSELEPLEDYLDELASDGRAVAEALAAAIRRVGDPAVVFCGSRSIDRSTGSVPAFLAAELGAAQALGMVRVQALDSLELIGERGLEGGRRERLRIPLPAVISVEAGGMRLRRAELRAALAATRLRIPVVHAPSDVFAARSWRGVHSGPIGLPAGCTGIHRYPARPFRPRARVVPAPPGASPGERIAALTAGSASCSPSALVRPASAAEAADMLLEYLRQYGYHARGLW